MRFSKEGNAYQLKYRGTRGTCRRGSKPIHVKRKRCTASTSYLTCIYRAYACPKKKRAYRKKKTLPRTYYIVKVSKKCSGLAATSTSSSSSTSGSSNSQNSGSGSTSNTPKYCHAVVMVEYHPFDHNIHTAQGESIVKPFKFTCCKDKTRTSYIKWLKVDTCSGFGRHYIQNNTCDKNTLVRDSVYPLSKQYIKEDYFSTPEQGRFVGVQPIQWTTSN